LILSCIMNWKNCPTHLRVQTIAHPQLPHDCPGVV
jgi:hypothetical protein